MKRHPSESRLPIRISRAAILALPCCMAGAFSFAVAGPTVEGAFAIFIGTICLAAAGIIIAVGLRKRVALVATAAELRFESGLGAPWTVHWSDLSRIEPVRGFPMGPRLRFVPTVGGAVDLPVFLLGPLGEVEAWVLEHSPNS